MIDLTSEEESAHRSQGQVIPAVGSAKGTVAPTVGPPPGLGAFVPASQLSTRAGGRRDLHPDHTRPGASGSARERETRSSSRSARRRLSYGGEGADESMPQQRTSHAKPSEIAEVVMRELGNYLPPDVQQDIQKESKKLVEK